MLNSNRIGYWLSEKKSQKINVTELKRVFGEKGYELVKIDLEIDIEQQGPFDAIIHKLSDLLCKLECDASARHQYKSFEVGNFALYSFFSAVACLLYLPSSPIFFFPLDFRKQSNLFDQIHWFFLPLPYSIMRKNIRRL